MPLDPLSDVLSLLKPRTYLAGGFELGGKWSIEFKGHDGIKCWALMSGSCQLSVDGAPGTVQLEAGDCVLLPNGRQFGLTNDPDLDPVPFDDLRLVGWNGGIATLNGGGNTMVLGGHFAFNGAHGEMLLGAMPPVIHLRDEADKTGMRWALERMRQELVESPPGSSLVAQHLAHLMLVQALRIYLANGVGRTVGWLFALGDPQLAAAIGAIHADPGAAWTLPMLAKRAGMSRSVFARRFKGTVGLSPIEYLTRWRMLVAGDRLGHGKESVAVVADSLGYASESAFSTAFKRVIGTSPSRHTMNL